MPRLAETRITLITPPRPSADGPHDPAAWRAFHNYQSRLRSLKRMRKRAHLADLERLERSLDALQRARRFPRPSHTEYARLARAVAREADRLKHESTLRSWERVWVNQGVAHWLEESVPTSQA